MKMGSIEEEDLTNSVDFEFYDPGGHKEENVTFNKVYDKPPPGRQRSISTTPTNKVCYENSTYNGTNKNNDQEQHESNGLDELELNRRKKDSVLLMNGIRKDSFFHNTTRRKNSDDDEEEDEERVFKFVTSEENDFQSGLDVSISDDTEDEDDIYSNNDLLVDENEIEITDDEDENVHQKKEKSQDADDLNYSGSETSKSTNNDFDLGRRIRRKLRSATLHNNGIVLPLVHHQYNSVSCLSESSSSANNDLNESDLSSLDDDDDSEEDDDEVCCSGDDDDDESTDEEVDNPNSNTNSSSTQKNDVGSMVKSLGKNGPTPPRKIFLSKNGLSFAERNSLQKSKRTNCNNHTISSSSPNNKSDMNCNNIGGRGGCEEEEDEDDDDDCSSASEMTDVSPLASSAENSPTLTRKSKPPTLTTKDTIISFCSSKSSPTTTLNGKNGFCSSSSSKNKAASGYSDIDMNVIMKAVEEISKEDEEEKWKRRCNSKMSSSSSSSSPNRKRNGIRTNNITYTNERARQIERENERLLSQLLKLSSSSAKSYKVGYKVPLKSKISHSAINRQREQRRIDKENEAFLRRLQSTKVSHGLSRDEHLEEFNSKHVKCPRNKSTRNNGSPFKRPFTATSSSSRNSIISLATDANSIPLSKRSVFYQSTPEINSRPEWVSKW